MTLATEGRDASLPAVWLGRRRYAPVLALQHQWFELRKQGAVPDAVFCLEHESVITLGRGAERADVLADADTLRSLSVDLEVSDRGGEITVHAPGQLVCYPIMSLAPDRCDVRRYVRDLTATMQSLVESFGVGAGEIDGLIGLWVDAASPARWPGAAGARRPAKLGAIGVRLSRWISMHGFALNLRPDLSLFRLIVPCGIRDREVCSLESLGARAPSPHELAPEAVRLLATRLGRAPGSYWDAAAVADRDLLDWLREKL